MVKADFTKIQYRTQIVQKMSGMYSAFDVLLNEDFIESVVAGTPDVFAFHAAERGWQWVAGQAERWCGVFELA